MADNMIGNKDASVQQIILNSQQAQQQNTTDIGKDDGSRAAERKAAEKRLSEKQQEIKKEVGGRESFDKAGNKNALYEEAFSGRMGPDVQRWAKDDGLQQKLTGAQKRLFLESFERDAPRTQKAAEAINRLATSDVFAAAVPTSRAMGEVQQTLLREPALEAPMQQVLQSRFMQAPKADAGTKADFLRFGMQNMQKGNLQSVKAAGDMLGTLAGQTPAGAQRAAMKMVQRDPKNFSGIENVDAFVKQSDGAVMPRTVLGRATEVLARGDGDTGLRGDLESVASDKTFSTLGSEDKARIFSTIGQGRTSDFRAVTDKMLQTLRSPDFPARESQVGTLLTQMGKQVRGGGAKSVEPRALIQRSKKSVPELPVLVSMADIDPEDPDFSEKQSQARSQNRAKVMEFYGKMQGSYDKVQQKIDGAKYFEDLSKDMDGLRPTESPDLSALDVSDDVRQQAGDQLNTLKQGLRGSDRGAGRAQFNEGLNGFQRNLEGTLGRPLTTDEVTFVLATVKQATSDLRYADLAKEKNQRSRNLRGSRMPPAKRQREEAARRVDGEQPRYFSPGANRAARGAFGGPVSAVEGRAQRGTGLPQAPTLGRAGSGRSDLAAPQGNALPRGPAFGQLAQRTGVRTAEATGTAGPMLRGRAAAPQGMPQVGTVEDEIAGLMASLDPTLSPAAKMAQAKNLMANQMQRHIQVATGIMNALMAEPGEADAANQGMGAAAAGEGAQENAPAQAPVRRGAVPTPPPLMEAGGRDGAAGAPPRTAAAVAAELADNPAATAFMPSPLLGKRVSPGDVASDPGLAAPALSGSPADEAPGRPEASGPDTMPRAAGQPGAMGFQAGALGAAGANSGPQGGPKSLAAVEAIGERPRGAAAALARLVAEAGAQPAPAAYGTARAVVPQAPAAAPEAARPVQGKTDGWNIPRTFERDLGARGAPVVRPTPSRADSMLGGDAGPANGMAAEAYTGKSMVKSTTPIRDVATLQTLTWKELTPAETALLQNLDWKQATWDTQTQPKAQWPSSMSTAYGKLKPKQREAVRLLNISAEDWDEAVGGGGSGGARR